MRIIRLEKSNLFSSSLLQEFGWLRPCMQAIKIDNRDTNDKKVLLMYVNIAHSPLANAPKNS